MPGCFCSFSGPPVREIINLIVVLSVGCVQGGSCTLCSNCTLPPEASQQQHQQLACESKNREAFALLQKHTVSLISREITTGVPT